MCEDNVSPSKIYVRNIKANKYKFLLKKKKRLLWLDIVGFKMTIIYDLDAFLSADFAILSIPAHGYVNESLSLLIFFPKTWLGIASTLQ